MPVLENLHAALKYLRYQPSRDTGSRLGMQGVSVEKNKSGDGVEIQDPPLLMHETRGQTRIVWADAICINQGDILERESQVRFMGDAYQKCSRGIVWL